MLELARHPNIAGVKQAVGGARHRDARDPGRGTRATSPCSAATTRSCFPTVLMGGAGAICAAAHVCTERFVAMIECGLAGKVDDGRAHAEALLPVVQALLRGAEPVGVQGRAARPGSDPDRRRAPAARERRAAAGRRRPRAALVDAAPTVGELPVGSARSKRCVAERSGVDPMPFRLPSREAEHDDREPLRTSAGARVRTALADPRRCCASACS